MKVIFGGRIRSVHPKVLGERSSAVEPAAEEIQLPALPRRREADVPVLHNGALGVEHSSFEHLPARVWNHVRGAEREFLKAVCGALDQAFADSIDVNLEKLLDEVLPSLAYALGRELIQAVVGHHRGFYGSVLDCDYCRSEGWHSGQLLFKGYRSRTVLTRLGPVRVPRAYYHCERGHNACPLDELLGVDEHGALPEIQQKVAELASRMPYKEAVETVEGLLPLKMAVSTGELMTMTVATQVQCEQDEEVRLAFADPVKTLLPKPDHKPEGRFAVVAADGGMCRIKNQKEYTEFKAAVMGVLDPDNHAPEREARVMNKSYLAHIGDADSIFQYMQVEFSRKGLDQCEVVQFLGDGADWIWNRAPQLKQPHQEFIATLDFYHALEYIEAAGAAIFPTEKDTWVHAMASKLKRGRITAFFAELQRQRDKLPTPSTEDPEHPVVTALRYFKDRKHLLTYKRCKELGLPIGSGMIEGGVRFVGKDRLHRTGMAWTVAGAEAILQLRCLRSSQRWESFFANLRAKRISAHQKRMLLRLRAA